jgi:uncharacterized protein
MMATDTPAPAPSARTPVIVAVLALVTTVGGLLIYKTSGALGVLAKACANGALSAKAGWLDVAHASSGARPFVMSVNYFAWIMIALAFGIVISATVRAFVPARWLERTLGARGARGHAFAALAGAPLMLCSCCVSPVFEGVFARTRRLGPSLGMMLAAPALNPAVLAATFLIFPPVVAWVRLVAALALVLGGTFALGRVFHDAGSAEACTLDEVPPGSFARAFGASLVTVIRRSLPAILLGILASAAIAGWIPVDSLASHGTGAVLIVILVALVAVPLALPTFGEIPLALALIAAGAPLGAAAALLVAGPAINLPSLFALARATSWRVAVATATIVFVTALAAGWLVLAAA